MRVDIKPTTNYGNPDYFSNKQFSLVYVNNKVEIKEIVNNVQFKDVFDHFSMRSRKLFYLNQISS